MRARKLAISLPAALSLQVKEDATSLGQTVSGWLADAAQRKLRRKAARKALASYEADQGVITEAELRRVRKLWRG